MKKISLIISLFLCVLSLGAQEQIDDNGLIVNPAEGDLHTYSRSGNMIIPIGFSYSESQQDEDPISIVYCSDGTVYMQHAISHALKYAHFGNDYWIKGTYADGQLTFPSQPISYSNYFHSQILLAMGDFECGSLGATSHADFSEPIIFQESAGGRLIELMNSSSSHVLGAYYDDGDPLYYWDYNTLLRDLSVNHGDAVTPPSGAAFQEYVMSGSDAAVGQVNFMPRLIVSGEDVYLGSFCFHAQGLWIKGHKEGENLVFPSEQYLTTNDYDDYTFYALAINSNDPQPVDLVLQYDAATGRYASEETDIFISRNLMQGSLDRIERVSHFSLAPIPAVASAPIYGTPEGSLASYYRQGLCTYSNGLFVQWLHQEEYESVINIITGNDGKTIYMQDPICMAENGAWVKGSIDEEGIIHMPLFQWIQQDEQYGYLRTAVCERSEAGGGFTYNIATDIHEVTFSMTADSIFTLLPMGPNHDATADPPVYLYSLVRATDLYWTGVSDATSIYTPTGDDNPSVGDHIDISTPVAGEEYNEYGILTKPGNGTELTFSRQGYNYSAQGTNVFGGSQEGYIHLVETADGWVYMQRPLSSYSSSYAATSWIKGRHCDDGTYKFPANQPINYDLYYDASISLCMTGGLDADYGSFNPNRRSNIVFEVSKDGKTLTLTGTSADNPLASFYDDDDAWNGYGDYNTVLTYVDGGFIEETTKPSDDLERLPYLLRGYDVEEGPVMYKAQLAFDGDVVYMGNFSFWAEDLWVKGRREESGRLVFPKGQFLRNVQGFDLFFNGAYENKGGLSPCDFDLYYNEVTGTYTTDTHMFLSWYEIGTAMNRAEEIINIILEPDEDPDSEGVIITGEPEGKLYYYKRTGGAFGYGDEPGPIYMFDQEASKQETVGITYAPDGRTVYMYNPISFAIPSPGSWVQGRIDDDGNLHFPLFQWVEYNHEFGYGHRTALLIRTEGTHFVMLANFNEVVFELDPATGVLSLQQIPGVDYSDPENPNIIYGLVYSDNFEWSGYGDFNTVYYPEFEWKGLDDLLPIETLNPDAPARPAATYDLEGRHRPSQQDKGLSIHGNTVVFVK